MEALLFFHLALLLSKLIPTLVEIHLEVIDLSLGSQGLLLVEFNRFLHLFHLVLLPNEEVCLIAQLLVLLLQLLQDGLVCVEVAEFFLVHRDGNLRMVSLIILLLELGNLILQLLNLRVLRRPDVLELLLHLILFVGDEGKFRLETSHAVEILRRHYVARCQSLLQVFYFLLQFGDRFVLFLQPSLHRLRLLFHLNHFDLQPTPMVFCLLKLLHHAMRKTRPLVKRVIRVLLRLWSLAHLNVRAFDQLLHIFLRGVGNLEEALDQLLRVVTLKNDAKDEFDEHE